ATMDKVIQEAGLRLSARLDEARRAIDRIGSASISDKVLEALMSPFESILRDTASGLLSSVQTGVLDAGAHSVDDPAAEFSWETMQDGRTCFEQFENSCEPRHGWNLTLEEWDSVGRPQAENLICSIYAKGAFSNCRCFLSASDVAEKSPKSVDVSAAVAAGRE